MTSKLIKATILGSKSCKNAACEEGVCIVSTELAKVNQILRQLILLRIKNLQKYLARENEINKPQIFSKVCNIHAFALK